MIISRPVIFDSRVVVISTETFEFRAYCFGFSRQRFITKFTCVCHFATSNLIASVGNNNETVVCSRIQRLSIITYIKQYKKKNLKQKKNDLLTTYERGNCLLTQRSTPNGYAITIIRHHLDDRPRSRLQCRFFIKKNKKYNNNTIKRILSPT